MRTFARAALLLTTVIATPAFAQDAEPGEFQGFYVGGSIGITFDRANPNETILFDRDLNGQFGDTVTTTGGVNAFGPTTAQPGAGFCVGSAGTSSTRPANGCDTGSDEIEYSGRLGYDMQSGKLVYGLVLEAGKTQQSSSVTAFSITPASYTITREIDYMGSLRARVGYTVTPTTLAYVTGGLAYAKLDNSFTTTNTVNSVTLIDDSSDSYGAIFGGGIEQKIGRNFSIGIEGTLTMLADDEFRARVGNNGTTLASNPFLLGNPNGTDFRRSDFDLEIYSVRAVAAFRF